MKYIIIILMLTGCGYEPIREFNLDDTQDGSCYGKFGGRYGYCDVTRNSISK